MNQKGRDFLSSKIEEVYKKEVAKLEKPEKPKIDDLIRESFLKNEISVRSQKEILESLQTGFAKGKIKFEDNIFRSKDLKLELDPFVIIEEPPTYREAMEKYKIEKENYDRKISDLANQKDSLLMKIQIGSDKALAPLVDQADSISLSIMNSQVILIDKQ